MLKTSHIINHTFFVIRTFNIAIFIVTNKIWWTSFLTYHKSVYWSFEICDRHKSGFFLKICGQMYFVRIWSWTLFLTNLLKQNLLRRTGIDTHVAHGRCVFIAFIYTPIYCFVAGFSFLFKILGRNRTICKTWPLVKKWSILWTLIYACQIDFGHVFGAFVQAENIFFRWYLDPLQFLTHKLFDSSMKLSGGQVSTQYDLYL